MIGSNGICYSHSMKELSDKYKSFEFGLGDVISCEYDPIGCKLRFGKNKLFYFEIQIIPAP